MKIVNKRAYYDYELSDKFEAGINLSGAEVKAIRGGHADLTGSYVRIIGSEAYLINAKIFPYQAGRPDEYDERRTRKLLLHKKEIISLKGRTEGANLSLVAISFYEKGPFIKVEVGLGKGKKQFEKKASIKKRDVKRQMEEELSN